jgi:hypothetical protein
VGGQVDAAGRARDVEVRAARHQLDQHRVGVGGVDRRHDDSGLDHDAAPLDPGRPGDARQRLLNRRDVEVPQAPGDNHLGVGPTSGAASERRLGKTEPGRDREPPAGDKAQRATAVTATTFGSSRTRALKAGSKVVAEVYVPAAVTGKDRPILVEWVPDGTVLTSNGKSGTTNQRIAAAAKLKRGG